MNWKRPSGKAGERLRVGRRTIVVPGVRSMTDSDRLAPQNRSAAHADPQPVIDRGAVQHLDRVRAIYRPTGIEALPPGLERFIGREDIFRRVGEVDTSGGPQPMMQCPPSWPDGARWVPIGDLVILEILDDQDIRAG